MRRSPKSWTRRRRRCVPGWRVCPLSHLSSASLFVCICTFVWMYGVFSRSLCVRCGWLMRERTSHHRERHAMRPITRNAAHDATCGPSDTDPLTFTHEKTDSGNRRREGKRRMLGCEGKTEHNLCYVGYPLTLAPSATDAHARNDVEKPSVHSFGGRGGARCSQGCAQGSEHFVCEGKLDRISQHSPIPRRMQPSFCSSSCHNSSRR